MLNIKMFLKCFIIYIVRSYFEKINKYMIIYYRVLIFIIYMCIIYFNDLIDI